MKSNDVLQRLFKWKKEIEIEGVRFYLRIVGDQVVEDVRQASLLASRKMRRALRDRDSNEFLLHIDPIQDFNEDEIKTTLTILAAQDVMRDYTINTPKPIVEPLNDHPTLEDQERHQQALEDRDTQYIETMQQYVEEWRKGFMESLEKWPRPRLEAQYARYRTDKVCEQVFDREFEDRLVCASIFTDDTYQENTFTLEEYRSLPNEIRAAFVDAYTNITLPAEELKN